MEKVKRMRGGGFVHFNAAFLHFTQVGDSGGEDKGQFLHGAATTVVVGAALDADGLQVGRLGDCPLGELGQLIIGLLKPHRKGALLGQHTEWIGGDGAT